MSTVFLFPIECLFFLIVQIRNFLFDIGLFKSQKFRAQIVSVGNLSVGGTGKTPFVAHLVSQLKSRKRKVAIVSRGYGGLYREEAIDVNPESENSAHIYGDEPTWYAKKLEVPVVVGRRRAEAVRYCLDKHNVDWIIADDAFQHRWLDRNIDIVLIDATSTNVALLPRGRFREPLSSLKRAHQVVLTKYNQAKPEDLHWWTQTLEKMNFSSKNKNLFYAKYVLQEMQPWRGARGLEPQEKVYLASGIAQPQSFQKMVESRPLKVDRHFTFNDHHEWTQENIDSFESLAAQNQIQSLIITEKDQVKMEKLLFRYLNVYVAVLNLEIEPSIINDKFYK